MQVTVADVVVETADTVTLVFDAPVPCDYRGGQYLTIDPHQFLPLLRFIQLMRDPQEAERNRPAPTRWRRRRTNRSPSPSRKSVDAGTREVPDAALAVPRPRRRRRHDDDGRGVHGAVLPARRHREPNGSHRPPVFRLGQRAELVDPESGAGGITRGLRHTWLYANTTWDDIIYRDALNALAAAHRDRLRVVHTLTSRRTSPAFQRHVRRGPITSALVRELAPDYDTRDVLRVRPCAVAVAAAGRREHGVEPAPRFMESDSGDHEGAPRAEGARQGRVFG